MAKTLEKSIRVAAVQIRNILGITEAEIKPGQVTLIEGRNGSGKTSILDSIRAALGGGNDVTLLRKGEDSGQVALLLTDGTEVVRTITGAGSKTRVKHPDFGALSKPATYLDKLRDAFSLNPVDFLLAKKDKRVELLLAAIPLRVNGLDIAEILELCASKPDLSRHALEVLDHLEKDLYDQRTGINRSLKDKRAAAEEMKKALPPEAGEGRDWKAELETAASAYTVFREGIARKESAISSGTAFQVHKAGEDCAAHCRTLEVERDAEIQRIRDQYQRHIDEAKSASAKVVEDLRAERESSLSEVRKEVEAQAPVFEQRIAELKASSGTYFRAQSAREHVEQLESGAASLEGDAQTLSNALKELESIKSALLDKLPIKGVEIKNGDVFVDGVAFDRVNESRRVRLAVEIAMLRTGNLPLLCVDGVEALDSASLAALEEITVAAGIQLIMAKVTDNELTVTTR